MKRTLLAIVAGLLLGSAASFAADNFNILDRSSVIGTDGTFSGNVTVGDASGDTFTVNAGTWTIGNNATMTRAMGSATGADALTFNLTFSDSVGGGTFKAMSVAATSSGSNAIGVERAIIAQATHGGSATLTTLATVGSSVSASSSGNVTTADAFRAGSPTLSSTGAITTYNAYHALNGGHATLVGTARGFLADDLTASATAATGFESQVTAGTNKRGFYASGTALNEFDGPVLTTQYHRTTAPNTQTGATYTVLDTDNWIIQNGGQTLTLTLPAAASYSGRAITVKTTAAFTTVSASSNVVPCAGGSAGTAILAATAGKFATLVSDATNWVIMACN